MLENVITGIRKSSQEYKIKDDTSTNILLCITGMWDDVKISTLSDEDLSQVYVFCNIAALVLVCYIVDYFLLMENWVSATTALDTRVSYHYQIIVCSFLVHQFTILLHFFKMWNKCAFHLVTGGMQWSCSFGWERTSEKAYYCKTPF